MCILAINFLDNLLAQPIRREIMNPVVREARLALLIYVYGLIPQSLNHCVCNSLFLACLAAISDKNPFAE